MQIKSERTGEEGVLRLIGELNIIGAPVLESEVNEIIDEVMLLTLDFTECDYVSSAGIRVIIGAWKAMEAKGGKIRMTNIGPQFSAVLQNIGLDEVIDRG